ncbi:uncharacterized protein LOC131329891 isoform X2 [Rhododendron vialii]|uniref:uncharacterized protein LOC131329891 isoform X2 n=1 Tax=Rhododendron vialii TaxID=182163 RepID=UPI00265EDE5C|nr:uncharacterized protein LOC131329891 isoform X2 [Rhododendron vialii]
MRGIGGPLLCIGDLLSDVGECDGGDHYHHLKVDSPPPSPAPSPSTASSSSLPNLNLNLQPSDLTKLFQLCTALETASKLVHSTNSLVRLLLEKVEELEGVVKRGDSAIAAAKAIHNSLNQGVGSVSSRNIEQPRL